MRVVYLPSIGLLLSACVACAQTKGAGSAATGQQHVPLTAVGAAMNLYTLHPGDTVDVSFRFTPEFNDEVVIGPDGHAVLKSTGDIQLAGLTLPEAQHKVVLDSSDKLVNPEVVVSLKDFERPQIVVAGEVNNPGKQELRKARTALQAILMAGGAKEDGAMGRVLLFRRIDSEYAEVHVLKLSKYDKGTRLKNDMLLQPDDMILVGHDNIESVARVIKMADLGVYLQPLNNSQQIF